MKKPFLATGAKPIKNKFSEIRYAFFNTIAPIVLFGMLIGAVVGVFVWAYGWVAEYLSDLSSDIYGFVLTNPQYIPLLFVGLVAVACIIYFVQKAVPESMGGGVPRTEGVIRGLLTFRWLRTLIGTVINSCLVYVTGMPLGSEGPSIQIGAALGQGINNISRPLLKRDAAWERYNIIGGASAGFATAFRAPLTGIIFALEEAVKHISPLIVLPAASSVLTATIVSRSLSAAIGASEFYFSFGELFALPIVDYWYLLILGIVVGLVSSFFCLTVYKMEALTFGYKGAHRVTRIIFAFVLTGVCGLLFADALGSGGKLIIGVVNMDFAWQALLVLVIVKMALIVFSVNSGATGGIFVPMLAVGALVGGLLGKLFIVFGMDEIYYKTIVVISMSAFMGAVMRSPITAMVLIVEVTGFLSNFLASGIAIFVAYFLIEALGVKPLYDKQVELLSEARRNGRLRSFRTIEMTVEPGAFAEGKNVRDILWPANTTITEVKVALSTSDGSEPLYSSESYDDGDRHIHAGDAYVFRVYTYDEQESRRNLAVLMLNTKDSIFDKRENDKTNGKGGGQADGENACATSNDFFSPQEYSYETCAEGVSQEETAAEETAADITVTEETAEESSAEEIGDTTAADESDN